MNELFERIEQLETELEIYKRLVKELTLDFHCPECGHMLTNHVPVARHGAKEHGSKGLCVCDEQLTGPDIRELLAHIRKDVEAKRPPSP